jgi:hypothetical protein
MAIYKNVLLVEGQDEVRTIPYLMGLNGIDWGKEENTVVKLRDCKGYTNIIKAAAIAVELKADGVEALGILLVSLAKTARTANPPGDQRANFRSSAS